MTTVIKAENISKQYRLGYVGSGSIKDDVKRWWYGIRGKEDPLLNVGESNDRSRKGESDYVWALKDINFEIQQGDIVGIIGRNGAGKSTLLKLLSKVTAPTTGNIKVKGRIASLLEVGTGFHGELTGRENIYLNGAIMGMRKHEITRRLDEIVDFAGVERYLDTPVKRYSSGMYVRLGFAVAAHLDNEILIVDEVLAVGDAEFQKKCLGKMGEVSNGEGRTILFVSHNIGIINQLCQKIAVLQNGLLGVLGESQQAIDYYLDNMEQQKIFKIQDSDLKSDTNHFSLAYNADKNLIERQEFSIKDEINLMVSINVPVWNTTLELAVSVYDNLRRRIFTIHEPIIKYKQSDNVINLQITIPGNFLVPGQYSWLMCINQPGVRLYDLHDGVCNFTIVDTGSAFAIYSDYGFVLPMYKIKLRK